MEARLIDDAVALLKALIAVPSFSREEDRAASVVFDFFTGKKLGPARVGNNVWVRNTHFDDRKPTLLLNSHIDTVRPNSGYTRDPFEPSVDDGRLFGLGSNDAGGPLVSLIATFLHFVGRSDLRYNIVMAATSEEEISGSGGVELLWPLLPEVAFAIVGEPTRCEMATAEKGLMVLDCLSVGKSGHAAREEGINAIYLAMQDIEWFRTFHFPRRSEKLGEMKMSVTEIQAGSQHNVVPSECRFTVDVRVTDAYTLEEALAIIKDSVSCQVLPRSLRMRSSGIADDHPLIVAASRLEIPTYGSPTTSDQALIPVPSVKMGPGDSARSHSADEFIYLEEIRQGIDRYTALLETIVAN
jgi:acetylornithine deacetylase